jgi:hypothetical protein
VLGYQPQRGSVKRHTRRLTLVTSLHYRRDDDAMRQSAAYVPIDPRIEDQLRRVRWRRRLHEWQRAAYVVLAVAGAGGAAAVLAALRGGTLAFVGATLVLLVGLSLASALTLRSLWRRRLPRAQAVVWIDDAAGLRGALATLATLRRPSPFAALLAERNVALLRRWTPERVVPTFIPVGRCVAAAIGAGALALAVVLAPTLRPAPPTVVTLDRPLVGLDAREIPVRSDRVLLGTETRDGADGGGHDGLPHAATPGDGAGTERAAWPMVVQERVRRALWGAEWDRIRDALARGVDPQAGGDPQRRAGRDGSRPERPDAGARAGSGTHGTGGGDVRQAAAERAASDDDLDARGDASTGEVAAGDGVDPNLFGPDADEAHATADPFALALAARVRTRQSGPRPPSGDTPDDSPDAHPALAARERVEDAAHRMSVPPQYESIVRALFAHAEARP